MRTMTMTSTVLLFLLLLGKDHRRQTITSKENVVDRPCTIRFVHQPLLIEILVRQMEIATETLQSDEHFSVEMTVDEREREQTNPIFAPGVPNDEFSRCIIVSDTDHGVPLGVFHCCSTGIGPVDASTIHSCLRAGRVEQNDTENHRIACSQRLLERFHLERHAHRHHRVLLRFLVGLARRPLIDQVAFVRPQLFVTIAVLAQSIGRMIRRGARVLDRSIFMLQSSGIVVDEQARHIDLLSILSIDQILENAGKRIRRA